MLEQGKYYHIYNRGNNREDLFNEERNYEYFLKLYAHHIDPIAEMFAYCLMKNHFHFLVRIKDIIESKKLKMLLKVFAIYLMETSEKVIERSEATKQSP